MAEWLVETCFIAACRFTGKPEDVVCVQVHGITFDRPIHNGDLLEIRARIALVGTTSITVHGQAFVGDDATPSVTGMLTFVTVDKGGKPYRHGLALPEDYIAQNRQIHEAALKVRRED